MDRSEKRVSKCNRGLPDGTNLGGDMWHGIGVIAAGFIRVVEQLSGDARKSNVAFTTSVAAALDFEAVCTYDLR